ncbi:pyruvate kinase, partial [Flavobacteriaceae bacterium]|nr:pyruvate kinase [Flavobacteriaceae bacterium]
DEGVNVLRINFSHAQHDDVKTTISLIKDLNSTYNYNAAILADLQGPKIRIGELKSDFFIKKGDVISFKTGAPFIADKNEFYMSYSNFANDVKVGEKILIDDGKLIFKVTQTNQNNLVHAKAMLDGTIRSNKGVNLPNTDVSLPALTKKDKEDAVFAISQEVDWIALSFVRNSNDLKDLNNLINKYSDVKIPVIAKIEKPEAILAIDEIIQNCDGLMVARGDLGVEIPCEQVPLIQKNLVFKAKKSRIPVIIATQMMESMMNSLTPSRAEVNDVANSIIDGADAVMLSGETSVGKFPVQVIKQISKIIDSVEYSSLIKVPENPPKIKTNRYITKAICYHASHMADEIDAKAIMTLTNSGYTAFQISAWRPHSNILVFTSNKRILNRLSLLWGVKAFYYDKFNSTDTTIEEISSIASSEGYISKGDFTISLASMPIKSKGMVNTLRVNQVT